METEGKGESQPVDKTNTTEGKANNRRVEFIKL
jgi:OOP family OmpA-OmpF porin